jgi:hypothetical protein
MATALTIMADRTKEVEIRTILQSSVEVRWSITGSFVWDGMRGEAASDTVIYTLALPRGAFEGAA